MLKFLLLSAAILSITQFAYAQPSQINIIPKPNSIKQGSGVFTLSKRTKIVAVGQAAQQIAVFFNECLRTRYGFKLQIKDVAPINDFIEFGEITMLGSARPTGSEAYSLQISTNSIRLTSGAHGLFDATQSLLQLLPVGETDAMELPAAEIKDEPRFPYRGMHLDVGRHFMPVEFVKKYIDLMSQYKFNYFHWHLTEDQGWRIEIKKYPKLTEVGSMRPETVKDKNLQPYVGDKTPHGGFYTQDQIRDVVAYAKARYITVIPEIEMPGHSSAALAAYPELGCKQDYNYKVQTTWGIFKEVYCPTEKTFQFLEDVISEVVDLFPDSPYIHIGGDEVLKDMWKDSPEVQDLMKRENLKDVNEVQSYFIRRMEKFINSKGKRVIGWDEILEGGLAPNATVMSWHGIKGGIEAAKAHHDVIMTPSDYAYFDYGQGDPSTEPINIGNYVPLSKVYSFDPVPKELTPDEAKYVIGGQGNVWTEYMATPQKVEYMVFPRLLALSEDLWTQPENKNYDDFYRRLIAQLPRLDKENVNYRIPEPHGLKNMVVTDGAKPSMDISTSIAGAKIYYTTDGSNPTTASTLLNGPISLDLAQNERRDIKTIVVLPGGRTSSVYAATVLKRDYIEPIVLTDKRPGVTYALAFASVSSGMPGVISGESKTFGVQQFARTNDLKQPFEASFDGYINVPADGIYEFQIESTWDGAVYVGGEKVVEQIGTKDRSLSSQVVPLKAGYQKVSFRYNNRGGEPLFRIRWGIKGQGLRAIGGGELVH